MVTTINYNIVDDVCEGTDSITISSDLITDYVAGLPSPDHTLDLKVTYLEEDVVTISITDSNSNLDTVAETYTLDFDDLSKEDTLPDGVYKLELVKTLTSNGSTTSEFLCEFVDCKVACKVMNYNVNNESARVGVLYSILRVQDNCRECDCSTNVDIYNKLIELLNKKDSCDHC